jgi:tRNA A-37 threonylcarbamoyl transferase component Bud32
MSFDPSYMSSAKPNQIRVRNDSTIKYLPNADFQIWFKPVFKRALIGIALVAPALVVLQYCHLLSPILALAVDYLRLFKTFLTSAGSPATAAWIGLLSNVSVPIFAATGLAVAVLTWKAACEPDIMYLSEGGLYFGRTMDRDKAYCNILVTNRIMWNEIKNIDIIRPANTRSNLDYCFVLQGSTSAPQKVRFGDIINAGDRQAFLNILKSRFSQWVDDEALVAFAPPPDRQSYTELWLSELSAPPKRDRLTPLEAGARLFDQKYQVVNKLGVGGQGTVYLALCGEEEVVLKEFVLPVFPDQRVRKAAAVRFQEEANLLTKLDHPQIVKLKDLFLEDHRAYLVLEHMTGQNLKDLVAEQGPLPAKEIFRLARQMCEILVYLHGQQPPVVHRDFTPDNLILDLDGQIKLIDFSVAQSFTSNVTGSVVGKPHYIAPEQFRGKPTCQSDIYSMGATLFYLATGIEPEPITTLRLKEYIPTGADSKLAAIIERSTKLDVSARYQNAAEVLQQLS